MCEALANEGGQSLVNGGEHARLLGGHALEGGAGETVQPHGAVRHHPGTAGHLEVEGDLADDSSRPVGPEAPPLRPVEAHENLKDTHIINSELYF